MLIIKILSFAALLGSIIWFLYEPDFEPALAILTSISGLITAWVISKRESASQIQTVGNNAVGIQSGGSVNVGNIIVKGNESDVK